LLRIAESVVNMKVNKRRCGRVDANKLMPDARFKSMKVVASLAGHTDFIFSVAFSLDGQTYCFSKWCHVGKGMVCSGLKGKKWRRWLYTGFLFVQSPSVPMGNILSQEVMKKLVTVWSV
jgi:hypothetical protein